ncbi:induced myeloid leukemia cell differentiation protein Mcl-1a [Salminus brasiliensis]|uniref:induced myeloid leukemia cell differentiation protein Mcl-1a n=1 Tax=Salminus brasiliensis TaxID=930266 RepID=UPI003B832CCC
MDRTAAAISFLCDGANPGLFKKDKEGQLDCTDRPDLAVLEGLQVPPGSAKASLGGGSLPESPQSPSDDFLLDFSPGCRGALEEDTRRLIGDFYRAYTGQKLQYQHPALQTMSRVVEGVIHKHRIAYNGMVKRLNLEKQNENMEFISNVSATLFSDGTTNWGRIASLVAFGAVVCERLMEAGREQCVDTVAGHISTYLSTHQDQWLVNNKAWDGFVEFFREDDSESRVRNALMAIAGFAGLGAGLALLMR